MLCNHGTVQWDTILDGLGPAGNIVVLTRVKDSSESESLVFNDLNSKKFYQYRCIHGGNYFENMTEAALSKLELIDNHVGSTPLADANVDYINVVVLLRDPKSAMSYVALRQIEIALQKAQRKYKFYYCLTSNESYKRLDIKFL